MGIATVWVSSVTWNPKPAPLRTRGTLIGHRLDVGPMWGALLVPPVRYFGHREGDSAWLAWPHVLRDGRGGQFVFLEECHSIGGVGAQNLLLAIEHFDHTRIFALASRRLLELSRPLLPSDHDIHQQLGLFLAVLCLGLHCVVKELLSLAVVHIGKFAEYSGWLLTQERVDWRLIPKIVV